MADADTRSLPLPPGEDGLPLLGQTLAFLGAPFGFVKERADRYGSIFRTSVLGRRTAVITGPDAAGLFIDEARVQRGGAMPPHIETLFAGRCLPLLDGEEHRTRKRQVMAAFSRDAIAGYVPTLQRIVRAHQAQWIGARELRWKDAFERLCLEAICETIMGLPPGPTVDRLRAEYAVAGRGFTALPIPLPGTAFSKARRALERILTIYDDAIRDHAATPRDDGLTRIMAWRDPTTSAAIAPGDLRRELHHIIVAGLIEWAWMVTAVVEIARHPEVRARLAPEVAALPATLDLTTIEAQPYLDLVAREVRRMSPVVSVFFGKARKDFDFAGYRVPAGWMVLWAHNDSHRRPEVFTDPDRFDPERFAPARAEHCRHEHAFVPNGAGPAEGHKCAGYEFAPLLLKVFLIELVRGVEYTLAAGTSPDYDWHAIPPTPRDGLRANVAAACPSAHPTIL